jgi:hypothetical protein
MNRCVINAGLLAAVHLPLLAVFFRDLWSRPDFRFFPLAICGLAWVIGWRCPRNPAQAGKSVRLLGALLLLASVVLLAAAVVIWSPVLSAIAAIFMTGALLIHFAGWQGFSFFGSVGAVAWLMIPLPQDAEVAIQREQLRIAAEGSSLALDAMHVHHQLLGTTLEFGSSTLCVEDLSGGAASLRAFLALTALYLAWTRRPPLGAILLFISAVAWSCAGNVMNVVAAVLVQNWLQFDVSQSHVAGVLNWTTFLLAFIMVISTDALSSFFLGGIPLSPQPESQNPWSRRWNRWIAGASTHGDVTLGSEIPATAETRVGWSLLGSVCLTGAAFALGILQLLIVTVS